MLEEYLQKTGAPLVVILGPTASGKTGHSIELARQCTKACEIVNADSRQLYRHLNIGTAKIAEEEMGDIPHHLFDVLDPSEEATAGWYQAEALRVIQEIRDRGNVPFLIGGSMLYLSTVIDDLSMQAPCASDEMREQITKEYEKDNGKALYEELEKEDPEAALRVHPNNKPRLIRAIEISRLCDESVHHEFVSKNNNALLIVGMSMEREQLCKRIEKRTEKMFERGWVEEVQKLLEMGYTLESPAMKSTGYKEITNYLQNPSGSVEELKEEIIIKTRQYAKRQMTWWKRDSRIQWITPTLCDEKSDAIEEVGALSSTQ